MSEKEKQIIERLSDIVSGLPDARSCQEPIRASHREKLIEYSSVAQTKNIHIIKRGDKSVSYKDNYI